MTQAETKVDYALMAKTAISRVTSLTESIEGVTQKIKMCREAWCDYGAALLAQRQLMPSNNEFGAWVKANALDTGLAKSNVTRSNAMWLAANWENVLAEAKALKHHSPHNLRQECREAGYAWAFDHAL
jgi:hypothetical protein